MELEEVAQQVEEKTEETTEQEPLKDQDKTEDVSTETKEPEKTEETQEPDPTDIVRALPKRKKSFDERIAEMTFKQREAERQAEFWRQEAAKKQSQPAISSDRPKLENFETQEAYEDALMQWNLTRIVSQEQEERKKERTKEALRVFNERADKVRAIHEDFDEVVSAPVFTTAMKDTLTQSDQGPVIAYYLGRPENLSEARRIASLPTELQPYEIGKLEARLLAMQKAKVIPGAPPPISPVTKASAKVSEDNLSDEEWVAMERKRMAERRLKPKYGG